MEERRKILIRARNLSQAKEFAKSYRKLSSSNYLPEKVIGVKYDKNSGLAGGVKGYTAILRRKQDTRPRTKTGMLYKSYQGRKPRL